MTQCSQINILKKLLKKKKKRLLWVHPAGVRVSAWSPHLPLKVTSWGLTAEFRAWGWGVGVEWLTLTSLCLSLVSSSWVCGLPPPP